MNIPVNHLVLGSLGAACPGRGRDAAVPRGAVAAPVGCFHAFPSDAASER